MTVTADTGVSGVQVTDTATAQCPNLQISPALQINKFCTSVVEVVESQVVVKVNVCGRVCNIGDTDLSNVTVTDDKAGQLLSGISLVHPADPNDPDATPGACADYSGQYFPSEVDSALPSDVEFTDSATATATDIFGNMVGPQSDMAECPLCPDSPGPCPPETTAFGANASTEAAAGTHTLTVKNGRGSGRYVAGDFVTVTADAPPPGKKFAFWSGDTGAVANRFERTTTVIIPSSMDIRIEAIIVDDDVSRGKSPE